jgi:plastocyanin
MSRLAIPLAAIAWSAGCAAWAGMLEVAVVDPAGKAVADAAVYAVPSGPPQEARGRTAQIEQVDREFLPFVSVVQVGTAVSFPNRDPILHHVYSFSPAKPFEIKLYSGKSPLEVTFDKPGIVVLGCNIHDWMVAYVAVVPTPYFARSQATGVVQLRDLPAGNYELHAWHPLQRAALPPQPVAISATGTTEARFTFALQPRKAKFKPPLDRLKY